MLQFPTSVTPDQAIATIASWNEVSTETLQQQVEVQAPMGSTAELARVQFVFGYMWRLWEEWYNLEVQYLGYKPGGANLG